MNDTAQSFDVAIIDLGAASGLTRGLAWLLPFYEVGVPPYNHFWPFPTT